MAGGLTALALLAGGCASAQAIAARKDADALAAMPDTPEALIQMRRGGCSPDSCPVYSLSVFTDGTVIYDGRANVPVMGQRRAKLTADGVNELISSVDRMDFLDTPERCCVCPLTAGSRVVILDYRPGSVQKTIIHDEACGSAPAAVSSLEQQLDRATAVARWTTPVAAATVPGTRTALAPSP